MGFMEGFADAFGRQMELGAQRRHETRRDAFQIAYDKYVKDRATYDAAKTEDTARINAAKSITSSLTAYGVPEAAWEHAYQWLGAGYTPGQVEEKLKTTIFGTTATPAMSDTAPAPQSSDNVAPPQSIDSQTAASGLVPGQEQTAGQQNPDLMGSIFGADGLLNPEANRNRIAQRAQDSVISQTGISREEFDRYGAGYQPYTPSGSAPPIEGVRPDPADVVDPQEAMANSLKAFNDEYHVLFVEGEDGNIRYDQGIRGPDGWVDKDGKLIAGNVTNSMPQSAFDDYNKAVGMIGPILDEVNSQKMSTVDLMEDAATLAEIVQKHPEVLTVGGQGADMINTGLTNLVSVFDLVGSFSSPEFRAEEQKLITAAQQNMGLVGDSANAYAAYMSQKIRFAFTLARANAGSGNMSNQEVQNAFQMIDSADPQDFMRQLQTVVTSRVNAFDRRAESLMNSYQVQEAMRHGVDPANLERAVGKIEPSERVANILGGNYVSGAGGSTPPSAPGADPTPEELGPVLDYGQITSDMAEELGLPPEVIGKSYRRYETQFEILD